jgi:ankyrin repeat protein
MHPLAPDSFIIRPPLLALRFRRGSTDSICLYLHIQVAAVLLEHGASNTATTKRGFTPLHLAAKYGNMKVAKLLLQKDAPVDAQGKVSDI